MGKKQNKNDASPAADGYGSYMEWKGWDGTVQTPEWLARYFAGEIWRIGLREGARILEIGFGNGNFMRWAEKNGHRVTGTEIIAELVDRAVADGLDAHRMDLTEKIEAGVSLEGSFDAIVAFDVLEHVSADACVRLLRNAAALVEPGGSFLARFPNGGSPFGILPQTGDYTHRQALTEAKLRQLACNTGWRLRFFGNAYRVVNRNSRGSWLKHVLFPIRNLGEYGLGWLYYGRRVPLDPVATAILVREDKS